MDNITKLHSRSLSRRKRGRVKKLFLAALTVILAMLSIYFLKALNNGTVKSLTNEEKTIDTNLEKNIFDSLSNKDTRLKAYNRAVSLNGGSSANSCVYFLSEVLRLNGMKIDDSICNTSQLISIMKKKGFNIERDYTKLRPGNICFTTDASLNKNGVPTHTYIFMGWKEEGSYDYAYICDNQARDYDGKIYHLRNIKKVENHEGLVKEPFSFYMYKEE